MRDSKFLFCIFLSLSMACSTYANEEDEVVSDIPPKEAKESYTLISSHRVHCYNNQVSKNAKNLKCKMLFIHQKLASEIHIIRVHAKEDKTNPVVDTNEVMKNPASYKESMMTIKLKETFPEIKAYASLSVSTTKQPEGYGFTIKATDTDNNNYEEKFQLP